MFMKSSFVILADNDGILVVVIAIIIVVVVISPVTTIIKNVRKIHLVGAKRPVFVKIRLLREVNIQCTSYQISFKIASLIIR